MKLINNKEMFEYNFGKKEERILVNLTCGDFKIFYSVVDKTYIIKRIDNKPFDGTESLNIQVYGNVKVPSTIEEKIEYCIENFTSLQGMTNNEIFNEFDYLIADDQIIVYPVYLNDINDCVIEMQTKIDDKLKNVKVSFGTRKKCRKLIRN